MKNRTQVYAFFKRNILRVLMIITVLLPLFMGCGDIPIIEFSPWDPKGKPPDKIKRLFNIHRGNWWNYYERGLAFMEEGFWEDAIDDLEKSISMRSKDQTSARTYGLKRVDYFANRELGIAYYKNAQEQNPKFMKSEFNAPLEIKDLCESIVKDQYNISLEANKNTLEWLNKLLEVSNFYDAFQKVKSNSNVSDSVVKLVEKTTPYREKDFVKLDDDQKTTIKKLNRHLLEETYPQKTPKIHDQYQKAYEKLIASLDRVESSRTQFYLRKILKENGETEIAASPSVKILSPQDGAVAEHPVIQLEASIEDGTFIDSVWINGEKTFVEVGRKSFKFERYVKLQEGVNQIIVEATNLAGKSEKNVIKVTRSQQNKIKKASNAVIQPILLATTDDTIFLKQFAQEMNSGNNQKTEMDGEEDCKKVFEDRGIDDTKNGATKVLGSLMNREDRYMILLLPFSVKKMENIDISKDISLTDILFDDLEMAFKASNRFYYDGPDRYTLDELIDKQRMNKEGLEINKGRNLAKEIEKGREREKIRPAKFDGIVLGEIRPNDKEGGIYIEYKLYSNDKGEIILPYKRGEEVPDFVLDVQESKVKDFDMIKGIAERIEKKLAQNFEFLCGRVKEVKSPSITSYFDKGSVLPYTKLCFLRCDNGRPVRLDTEAKITEIKQLERDPEIWQVDATIMDKADIKKTDIVIIK